jgi:hypothetical protein
VQEHHQPEVEPILSNCSACLRQQVTVKLFEGLQGRAVPRFCVCFITAGPITKLCAWGEEESGGHVL